MPSGWTPGDSLQRGVRLNPVTGAEYGLRADGLNGMYRIFHQAGSGSIVLASASGPVLSPGDTLRIEVDGQLIRCFVNAGLVLSATDTNLTSGTAGVTFVAESGTPAPFLESWTWNPGPAAIFPSSGVLDDG